MPGRARIDRRRGAGTAALLASLAFHGAVLLILARYLAQVPASAEAPVVNVTLVPARPPPAARRAPPDRPRDVRRPAAITAPLRAPLPPHVPPLVLPPPPPEAATLDARAQRTLRSLTGCDPGARLTPEERERCETRRALRGAPSAARLKLDPSGRYVENPQPFLSRRPKDGCRARATGDVDPMGDSGAVRAGVGCAFSF